MANPFEVQRPDAEGNAASSILKMITAGQLQQNQGINQAQVELLKYQNKEAVEANEYGIQLLSRVQSEEDLQLAKDAFRLRYPHHAGEIDQLIPTFDPQRVRFLADSLKDANAQLKQQEIDLGRDRLAFDREKFGADQAEPKVVPEGSALMQGGEIIGRVPKTPSPTKPEYDLFQGPDGNQVYITKGSKVPSGYTKTGGKGINIQVGGETTKATTSKLEQDIVEGVQSLDSFSETKKLFKDKYLTYVGKGVSTVTAELDKAGLSTQKQRQFITERSKWFRQAKQDFIKYRKWATGVAGGEQELKEIATSFPDPVKNSPTEYKANLDSIEETTKRVLATNAEFLASGISINQPLGDILAEMRDKGMKVTPPPGVKVPEGKAKAKSDSSSGQIIIDYDKDGNRLED